MATDVGKGSAAGSSICWSEVDPTNVVRWRGRSSLGFKGASIKVHDAYDNTVEDAATFSGGVVVSGSIEDDEDWSLGTTPLPRSTDARASLCVDFFSYSGAILQVKSCCSQ